RFSPFPYTTLFRSMGANTFEMRVQEMVSRIRSTPLAAGAEKVLVPGEREAMVARASEASGIAYPQDIFASLELLANECGIDFPKPLEKTNLTAGRERRRRRKTGSEKFMIPFMVKLKIFFGIATKVIVVSAQ